MKKRTCQIGILLLLSFALTYPARAETMVEAQKKLADENTDANTLFSLSFYFEQSGRPFSALKAIERAIQKDPKVPGYAARQGQLLLSRKRTRDAAAAYGRAADMDPATKSFRATQARAYVSCSMTKEAAATWEKLLALATDRQEILDAARNTSNLHQQLNDFAAAEKSWRSAWEKLTTWNDRTSAGTQLALLFARERADERTVEFYDAWQKSEPDWQHRAVLGQAMVEAARRGIPAESSARVRGAWSVLLESATDPHGKQWAAAELGELLLDENQTGEALKTVTPLIFGPPGVDLRLARVASSAYALQNDVAAQEKIWRDILAAKPGFNEQNEAIRQIAGIIKNTGAIVALRRESAAAFPDEVYAQKEFAQALVLDKQFDTAIDVYSKLFTKAKARTENFNSIDAELCDSLVNACAQSGDLSRLAKFIGTEFQGADAGRVRNWVYAVANQLGEAAAIKLSGMLSEQGTLGSARVGAALYLSAEDPDRAKLLFEALGRDEHLSDDERRLALQQIVGRGTLTNAEHIDTLRRLLSLHGDFWSRWQYYQQLASLLGAEGQFAGGIELIREASKERDNNGNQSPAPNALRSLGNSVWRGPGVGAGLRSSEGLLAAQSATAKLYQEISGDPAFQNCFDDLCRNLAEVQAQRGDIPGAISFLHKLCALRDEPQLRLAAIDLFARRNDRDALWNEYLSYVDAVAHSHAEALRNNHAQHFLPNLDGRLIQYVANTKKELSLYDHFDTGLKSPDRESFADALLSYQRIINKPAELIQTLARLKIIGISGPFYTAQREWAEAAVKLDNAGSRADAQRREQLLKELENWKTALAANPEDYQAALNVYKTFQQLGRQGEGRSFLDQELQIAPGDPLVLELHARELMLEKSYGDAAKELMRAAESTGSLDGVEAMLEAAYELAGHHAEAIALSLDALEQGHNNGQGIRNIQEIQDLAHRSNGMENLKTQLNKRLQAIAEQKRVVPEGVAELALNVGWDTKDEELSRRAIDGLLALAWQPGGQSQNLWKWQQLEQQANARRRTGDAIRLSQAILTSQLGWGQRPNAEEYRKLAAFMVQGNRANDAAELMIGGMIAALRPPRNATVQLPWDQTGQMRWDRPEMQSRGHHADRKKIFTSPEINGADSIRREWVSAILTLAASEQDSGADTFRKACGERFDGLVDDELKNPSRNALSHPHIAIPLGLRERVEAAYHAQLESPAATADDWLGLANWRMEIANLETDSRSARTVRLEEITAASAAAIQKAEVGERARVFMAVASLYNEQAHRAEDQRVPGFTIELALNAWDAAAAADPLRNGLEALQPALQLAQAAKLHPQFLVYARKLHGFFPDSFADASMLASALLLNKNSAEAVAALKPFLEAHPNVAQYTETGRLFLKDGAELSDAAQDAAAYFSRAIELQRAETGTPLDSQGKALPDSVVGELQAQLSVALASCGKFDGALTALSDASGNGSSTVYNHERIVALAGAFQRASRIPDLTAALEAKVRSQPHNVELRLALADIYETSGDAAGAVDTLSAAKAIRADLTTVKRLIATLRKLGENDAALAECKLWAANFPSDAEAHETMAAIYKDLHNAPAEVQALTMLVESAPREAAQCRAVAVMLAERHDYSRARTLLERAMELRAEEPYRVIDLAEVCFLAQDYTRAEQLCTDALGRDWSKGLSPELVARMPRWKGTFEDRAHSLLADIYAATQQPEKLSRERLLLPQNYKRPSLDKALPNSTTAVRRL